MKNIVKCIAYSLCLISLVYAGTPYETDFSLSTHVVSEPPALPQNYGIELPSEWEYYPAPVSEWQKNPFLPDTPMLMEICAITDTQMYQYNTKEELMSGCYRNDKGLSYFVLQPYQYWSILSTLKGANLVLQDANIDSNKPIQPKIVAYYKSMTQPQVYSTIIELGDFYNESSLIAINGKPFLYNIDIMMAFYALVYEIENNSYMRDTQQYYAKYP